MSRIKTTYIRTWSSNLFTITYGSGYAPQTFSSQGYLIAQLGSSQYFVFGPTPDTLTTLDWTLCTSPVGSSATHLITKINNLISSTISNTIINNNALATNFTTDYISAVTGDPLPRFTKNAEGDMAWRNGSAAQDVRFFRGAANSLSIDDTNHGPTAFSVDTITVNTSGADLMLYGQGTGNIGFGSNVNQNGIKFNNSTSGYTPTTFNYYEEGTYSSAWQGPWSSLFNPTIAIVLR